MNHHYADICDRIAEPPKWFDEFAVPRYCEFAPSETANIYAHEAALVLITCQDCGKEYRVAFSCSGMDHFLATDRDDDCPTLADKIKARMLHYGDPPNACGGSCAAGATMNSEPRRVLQYWHKVNHGLDWARDPAFEIEIAPDWVAKVA